MEIQYNTYRWVEATPEQSKWVEATPEQYETPKTDPADRRREFEGNRPMITHVRDPREIVSFTRDPAYMKPNYSAVISSEVGDMRDIGKLPSLLIPEDLKERGLVLFL